MLQAVGSSTRTELGRITKATFGWGGYDDAMIGLSIHLGGPAWGCGDFKGAWGTKRSERAEWSEEDRIRQLGEAVLFLRDLLTKAHVKCVCDLEGTPIEATFDNNRLVSWRVLEEVLP